MNTGNQEYDDVILLLNLLQAEVVQPHEVRAALPPRIKELLDNEE